MARGKEVDWRPAEGVSVGRANVGARIGQKIPVVVIEGSLPTAFVVAAVASLAVRRSVQVTADVGTQRRTGCIVVRQEREGPKEMKVGLNP